MRMMILSGSSFKPQLLTMIVSRFHCMKFPAISNYCAGLFEFFVYSPSTAFSKFLPRMTVHVWALLARKRNSTRELERGEKNARKQNKKLLKDLRLNKHNSLIGGFQNEAGMRFAGEKRRQRNRFSEQVDSKESKNWTMKDEFKSLVNE